MPFGPERTVDLDTAQPEGAVRRQLVEINAKAHTKGHHTIFSKVGFPMGGAAAEKIALESYLPASKSKTRLKRMVFDKGLRFTPAPEGSR